MLNLLRFLLFFFFQISVVEAKIVPKIAVTYFDNTAKDEALAPLSKGLSEMLITDLSVSEDIQLVERGRLNELLKEISLQQNPYFDQAKAAEVGKGLGAAYIIVGSYLKMEKQLRIDARLVDVESSEIALSVSAEGSLDNFFSIQKKLASEILQGLGASLSLIQQKSLAAGSTNNFDAFIEYSNGLDHLDNGDVMGAFKSFNKAKEIDPNFELVDSYLDRLRSLSNLTMEAIEKKKKNNWEDLLEYSKNNPRNEDECIARMQNITFIHSPSIEIFDAKKFSEERLIEYEKKLGILHLVSFQLLNTDQSLGSMCQNYRDQILMAYNNILKIIISPHLELIKAKKLDIPDAITAAENQVNRYPTFNFRNHDGSILLSSAQFIPTFLQFIEIILPRDDIFARSPQQKEDLASFVQFYSPFLYQNSERTVDDYKLDLVKRWLHPGETHFIIHYSDPDKIQINFTNTNLYTKGTLLSETVGLESDWVWEYIEKIEGKWAHTHDWQEFPRFSKVEETTEYFCSNRCRQQEFCQQHGSYGIIPETSLPTEKRERNRLNGCRYSVQNGWLMNIHTKVENSGFYPKYFWIDVSNVHNDLQSHLKEPISFRVTLTDGTTWEFKEDIFVIK